MRYVVLSLVSEAPTQTIKGIVTSTLEKILVDVYCKKNIFYAYQGNELKNIYGSAFEKYAINQSKLLRYASRREKKEEVEKLIKEVNSTNKSS